MNQVTVNGEEREFPPRYTLTDLLGQLCITGRYAVEVNEVILPRSRHATYELQAGDRIEIVHAIGGG
ncbi:MAG: sulfur carrier protein ThiS [Chromatiales bacterium]